jgi:hypothetical protein
LWVATVRSIAVQLRAEVANYIQGLKRARAATSDLINELSKAEEQRAVFERLGTGITIAGAGIAAGVGLATRAAIEWESAWTGVEKTVDGTETQLAALEEELRADWPGSCPPPTRRSPLWPRPPVSLVCAPRTSPSSRGR